MGLWHVFYADWQMECCGTPFSVGDEVSWPVLLSDADDVLGGGWHHQLTKLVGPVDEVRADEGCGRVLREESGLVVGLPQGEPGDAGPGDRIRLVGLLTVETHGGRLPEVRGRVRCVQVVTQGYGATAPGSDTWEPVPGRRSLRSVDECPKWFGGGREQSDAGVVATLEVPDTDSWLSHAVRESCGIPQDSPPGAETEDIPDDALAALLATLSRA